MVTPLESRAEGLAVLERWLGEGTPVWVYLSANNAGLASVMQGRVTEVSRCLVFKNEQTVLRLDIENARFRFAPLQALVTPSELGAVAAIAQRPDGLVGQSGLNISLASGHSVFVCEGKKNASNWLEFAATALRTSKGPLLGS